MTCNTGVNTAPKYVKNTTDITIFPFKHSLFPTDITLVDSLLKPCNFMTEHKT